MNGCELDDWFPLERQQQYVAQLVGQVGLTKCRAECFIRLWAYLLLQQQQENTPKFKPPLTKLELPIGWVSCTHRQAAELFYSGKERGSDRAAGMMLDKLVALGLIQKQFDGNTTNIKIQYDPQLFISKSRVAELVTLHVDTFNPRTDAISVANLLARNYNWMNKNTSAAPQRIAKLLRHWAAQYPSGMRVLRCDDNLNPVGFYLLYPIATQSESNFFCPPSKSLHLSSATDIDPIQMAVPPDPNCQAIFIRSWVIDRPYLAQSRILFLTDVQQVLSQMLEEFPNLCDLYTMIIHPSYEQLALALGFQKTSSDAQLSVYWVYLAVDRFLALNIKQTLTTKKFGRC